MVKATQYLFLIFAFVIVSTAKGVDFPKNGFSISLPDGWVEMPRDIIDSYEKEMARLVPDLKVQHYDYAFQLSSSKNWFEYPYVLIQVKNVGRIQETQLEKLEKYSMKEDIDELGKKAGSIMSDIQVGKMVYDNKNKIIWMLIDANVINIGRISGISGMVPTQKGFIQVSGYTLRENYSADEAIFRSVVMSVKPEPWLVYTPQWLDKLPPTVIRFNWSRVVGGAIVGAMLGGMFALIMVGIKKKDKRNDI